MTGRENKKKTTTIIQAVFIFLCALLCLIPAVGMLWAKETEVSEELAEFPALTETDADTGKTAVNTEFLSELGEYFEDHFAYRSEVITANAKLRKRVLGVLDSSTVVAGTDGWLYYQGTLSDYGSWSVLSGRAADNIAFNLSLMQDYARECGADFVVAIAPNKNSLYDENMPYYYVKGTEHNLEAVEDALAERGVNYAGLYDLFSAQDEVLYYRKDTHWNTKGALLATIQTLSAAGNTSASGELAVLTSLENTAAVHEGDLEELIYPSAVVPEEDYVYDEELSWTITEYESADGKYDDAQVESTWVAAAGSGTGTLMMYRDSFANNMIPFLADVYETSYYAKTTDTRPAYFLTDIAWAGADTAIIEIAERNLSEIGIYAAVMPAPAAEIAADTSSADADTSSAEVSVLNDTGTDTEEEASADENTSSGDGDAGADPDADNSAAAVSEDADAGEEALSVGEYAVNDETRYVTVSGSLPEEYRNESVQIYVGLETADGSIAWYEPFRLTVESTADTDSTVSPFFLTDGEQHDYGYLAYFTEETFTGIEKVWLACTTEDGESIVTVQGLSIAGGEE